MLKIGSPAPDFESTDDQGTPVSLRSLLINGPIILFFYPRDFTPVCTQQVCAFRDISETLNAIGLRIFGVSADGHAKHRAFRAEYSLPYPLLCDPGHQIARLYRAAPRLRVFPKRVSYLIGADGFVQDGVSATVRLAPHMAMIDRAIAMYERG